MGNEMCSILDRQDAVKICVLRLDDQLTLRRRFLPQSEMDRARHHARH
jgi:hypothetical protein